MSKYVIGYTSGVYDLFHIGHLKRAVIPFSERIEIVRNIKYVDAAIAQEEIDKYKMWEKIHFDVLFVGDDWYNSPSWNEMESKFEKVGVRVVYFPYTKGTSSTLLNETLIKLRET